MRRYYEVTIRMIAEPDCSALIEDVLRDSLLTDPPVDTMDVGEFDVLVKDLGDIKVNDNGYAVPLPKLEDNDGKKV